MPKPLRLLPASIVISIVLVFSQAVSAGPVKEAALSGDAAKLERLLQNGADPDEQGVGTPLYFASQRGHTAVVAVLLDYGADPNALSKWGSPLHIASRQGHVEVVELLLAKGADPNLQGGEYDATPLHGAASVGNARIVALLLDHGADPNARAVGRRRGPAIHFAAEKGHDEVVALLRERGAHPIQVDPITRTELLEADLEVGRSRAAGCTPCHTYVAGDPGERGPSLWNIVGRPIASEPNFPYTRAITSLQGVWDYEMLNKFLADVSGFAPGTDMYTGDEPDRKTRIALIAYLRTLSDSPEPLP